MLVFHGPDAMRDRDEFLRRLNAVKPMPMSKDRHKSRSESQIKILKIYIYLDNGRGGVTSTASLIPVTGPTHNQGGVS